MGNNSLKHVLTPKVNKSRETYELIKMPQKRDYAREFTFKK